MVRTCTKVMAIGTVTGGLSRQMAEGESSGLWGVEKGEKQEGEPSLGLG